MNPPVTMIIKQKNETNEQQEYIEYNDVNITNMKWMCKIKLENDNDDEQKIDSTNLNKPVTMIIKQKDETNEQQEYIEYNDVDVASMKWMCKIKLEDDKNDDKKNDSTDLNNLNNRKRSLLLPITCDLCRWPEHFTGKDVTPNAWKHLITYHMQTSHIWEWYTDMKMKEYNLI